VKFISRGSATHGKCVLGFSIPYLEDIWNFGGIVPLVLNLGNGWR
jgi:hypothetical protein